MRWVPTVLLFSAFAVQAASAQTHQLIATLDVYDCVEVNCTTGEACTTSGPGICTELLPGAPLCVDETHLQEPYCCFVDSHCPAQTRCAPVVGQAFGVCLGPGVPGYCDDNPTTRDLERCRQGSSPFDYDWGHGDCDGDSVRNDIDPTPCTSTPRCYCDADVVPDGTGAFNVDLTDAAIITMCIGDPSSPICDRADVNCDGTVDYCDVAAVHRTLSLSLDRAEHYVCGAVQCGNCLTPEGCVRSGRGYCISAEFLGGTFFGDADCNEPVEMDGGAGDGGPGDGAVGDSDVPDGTIRDSAASDREDADIGRSDGAGSGVNFRGAGGCACDASRVTMSPPPIVALSLGVLIALHRRRRRR